MRLYEIEDSDEFLLKKYQTQINLAVKKYNQDYSAIYRGSNIYDEKNILAITPPNKKRTGTSAQNYHNLWVEGDQRWSLFPNRLESTVCSTSASEAEGYGRVRVIVPLQNVKIGICPRQDFWFSFRNTLQKYHFNSIIDLNKIISAILVDNGIILPGEKLTSFKELYDALEKTKGINLDKYFQMPMHENLIEMMNHIYDPVATGFDITTWNSYDLIEPKNREIWFKGPYLSLRKKYFFDSKKYF